MLLAFVIHTTESDPTLYVMMDLKCRIEKKQVLLQNHACFDSRSEIRNQAHSTFLFNFLKTGRRQLGTGIHKPKTS